MDRVDLTKEIKRKALELGFARVGITTPDPVDGYGDELQRRAGYGLWNVADETSPLRQAAHPETVVPEAKSIISLVRATGSVDYPESLLKHLGRIYLARCYVPPADTIEGKRIALFEDHLAHLGVKSLYDHSNMQLVDRALAARAGVIEYGKNNFAYAGEHGSFIVITTIPVDTQLECEVHEPRRPCPENCRLCIDACPTKAMDDDGALTANRCVLYSCFMPGEYKDPEVVKLIGERIHGCDACQVACPRNKKALSQPKTKDPYLEWLKDSFNLEKLLFCDDAYYDACVKPVMFNYIKDIDVFRQNAAIAMGNSGDTRYVPALERAVREGSDEVKRWAKRSIELLREGQVPA